MRAIKQFGVVFLLLAIAGCSGKPEDYAPPRVTDKAPTPTQTSLIALPITTDTAALSRALERAVPRILWTINQREPACVPPQKVKVFGKSLKVTPAISCTIVGQVTRGALRLRGEGDEIVIDVPINATISARDVGGVLKGKTATGSAMAHARVKVELQPDWSTRGKASVSYGWTNAPGIDFLGKRITFTEKADEKLAPVIRDVEREVNREIAKLNIRKQAADIWRQSFTVLQLNRENPPVWMRVTPQRILYGGYRMNGRQMSLNLGMEAITETFVSDRPADATPSPLPKLVREMPRPHFDMYVSVIADYAQLEPVILRALIKRSARPFDLPSIGPVTAKFEKITAYATKGGKIAVGITMVATPVGEGEEPTRGIIWMTAVPVNEPNSAEIRFTDLTVTGDTNGMGGDLLLVMVKSSWFSSMVADALTQNLANDLEKLKIKIRDAIDQRQEGDFMIRSRIDSFETGKIKAYGNGLHLPVRMVGDATVNYR